MFGGTCQCAGRGKAQITNSSPIPLGRLPRKEKKKEKGGIQCVQIIFTHAKQKSPTFSCVPSQCERRRAKKQLSQKSGAGLRYATIIPLTDKSISPPSDNISDYLCYGNKCSLAQRRCLVHVGKRGERFARIAFDLLLLVGSWNC